MLQTNDEKVSLGLFKDAEAPVWQQVKRQIRCMKSSSFLDELADEIGSYPVAQRISTLRMNVDVWYLAQCCR